MSYAVAVLVVVVVAVAAVRVLGLGSTISAEQARTLVEGGARLVDVRSPAEFDEGHIEGAVNIPVDALGERKDELEPREQPVVVYCRSGARSHRAKQQLEAAGFTQVHNLGAMAKW